MIKNDDLDMGLKGIRYTTKEQSWDALYNVYATVDEDHGTKE